MAPLLEPPLAVSFDLDETLIEKEPTGTLAFIDYCSNAGLNINQSHFATIERFRQKYFSDTASVSATLHSHGAKNFWREYNRLVLIEALGFSPDDETIEVVTVRFSKEFRPRVYIMDDVLRTLAFLKSRQIPIGIITTRNSGIDLGINLGRAESDLEKLGVLDQFSFVLGVSPSGQGKPHPSVFLAAADAVKVPPERLLHIGNDFYADYQGAVNAKIRGVLFDRHSLYPELNQRISTMDEVINFWT